MPCEVLTTPESSIQIIACGPPRLFRRFYQHCETCLRRTSWLRRFDGVYYGYTEWCMSCNDTWQDGIRLSIGSNRKWLRKAWTEALTAKEFETRVTKAYEID